MKIPLLLVLFAVLALPGFQPVAAHAQDATGDGSANAGDLLAAVTQLFTDLGTIPAGSTATDAQHAALVADLDTLADGIFTPDSADVDQLATDLGTIATDGLLSADLLATLAEDFSAASDGTGATPGWLDNIQADVADALSPTTLIEPPPAPGSEVSKAPAAVGGSFNRVALQLDAQGIPPFLLENYSGRVQLTTHTAVGSTPVVTLRVSTRGLPPGSPYTVSITHLSDGASVVLGKLRVRNGFYGLGTAFISAPVISTGAIPAAEILSYGTATFGGDNPKKPLPAGFDAADVATVTVTDPQGVVRLTGSLIDTQPSSQIQALYLHLTGTSVTPASIPSANITARHRITGNGIAVRFGLLARHLPVSAPVTLLADGVSVGQFTTTAKGRLTVGEGSTGGSRSTNLLPGSPDLSGAKSFALIDAQGAVLLAGSLD